MVRICALAVILSFLPCCLSIDSGFQLRGSGKTVHVFATLLEQALTFLGIAVAVALGIAYARVVLGRTVLVESVAQEKVNIVPHWDWPLSKDQKKAFAAKVEEKPAEEPAVAAIAVKEVRQIAEEEAKRAAEGEAKGKAEAEESPCQAAEAEVAAIAIKEARRIAEDETKRTAEEEAKRESEKEEMHRQAAEADVAAMAIKEVQRIFDWQGPAWTACARTCDSGDCGPSCKGWL